VNGRTFTSPVYYNQRYVEDPNWKVTVDVPDDQEFVSVNISLWDWNIGRDKLCDISADYGEGLWESFDVELFYSIKSGHWFGDDFASDDPIHNDQSGYGRLNGCDDGSIYQHERDCELWFDIYQNDYDGDTVPYWTEVNIYESDPDHCDLGDDSDNDGIPLEWEHKWGHYFRYSWHNGQYYHEWRYHPYQKEDHETLDPDGDALNNVEEYLTSQWYSDPFRKDVFVELDYMETSPDGERCILPCGSRDLITTAFNRQNIMFHLDDGRWEDTESDVIPFDARTPNNDLQHFYEIYFLNNDENFWRRGVFRYGLVVYDADYSGYVFRRDAFQISSCWVEHNNKYRGFLMNLHIIEDSVAYASVYMHELGHTFDFYPIPGHDKNSYYPWQSGYWLCGPYKSCMNYRYCYRMVDYSDGSRGRNDYNDWERMDYYHFQS
jgi:hypothetical protein